MMKFLVWFPLLALLGLAGRALAFNITVGKMVITSDQILKIPDPSMLGCGDNCTRTQGMIDGCGGNVSCLCRSDVVAQLQNCQQCMFTQLIEKNVKPLDMRVGSTPLMGAYATSCKEANITLLANQTALTLPDSWNGPFVAVLPTGGVVITVIAGAFLGFSALLLLSNMA